jgi:hypothetical protein
VSVSCNISTWAADGYDRNNKIATRQGYSYVYLTADNFKLPQAKVKRGVLAPSGPSFKALVLTNESSITADVADDVVRYAKAGLPVIIAGTPSYYPSGGSLDSDSQEEKNAFQTLESTRNVYMTSLDEVASKLEALHIQPNVRVEANGLWHSTFRQDQKAKLDYIFILGDKIPTSGSITISSLGYPYLFDPWTGRREPILRYDRTGRGRIAISLGLAANQTSIIAISRQPLHDVPIPDYHLTLLPETVLGYSYSPETGLNVQVGAQSLPSSSSSSSENICLSNGEQVAAPSNSVPQSFELEHWKLTAEHWEAPEDMYDVTVVARKRNTTHDLASPLLPWTELDSQLHNASGVGYYASSFDWPPEGSARGDAPSGAYVSFRGKVQQTLRVSVNGHALQPIDPRAPEIDVGPYLKLGKNNILVVAPTTMWNYLRSILSDIKNAGDPPLTLNVGVTIPVPGPTENGLVGTVHVVPYSNVHV